MWLWRCAVQHTRPHITATEIDNILDMLSIGLHVCCYRSLLQGHRAALVGFTIHAVQSLTLAVAVRLGQYHHVCPVRVDHNLYSHTEEKFTLRVHL